MPGSNRDFFPPLQIPKIIQLKPPELFKDPAFLHQKYTVERLSTTEIAALTFSSKTTILKYLKANNIPLRHVGTVLRKKAGCGLAYGKRIERRKELEFKREQENIEKMKRLREQGFSYWKIADVLNSMKIPTKTGKSRWHSKTVHQIIHQNS